MAEAAENSTPRRFYDEAARAALRAHVERVAPQYVNWDALWADLEKAAKAYVQGVEFPQQPAPREIRKKILKRIARINAVRKDLAKPINWYFESYFESDRLVRGGLPGDWRQLDKMLAERRKAYVAEARELEGACAVGANVHQRLFQYRLLIIGHDALADRAGGVGYSAEGPLITFVTLALKPIFHRATPNPGALRSVALRVIGNRKK